MTIATAASNRLANSSSAGVGGWRPKRSAAKSSTTLSPAADHRIRRSFVHRQQTIATQYSTLKTMLDGERYSATAIAISTAMIPPTALTTIELLVHRGS